ncbi:MAG: hypothetical protein RL701_3697 [Pseudomonadota bacterium]|jgi:mannose-6-phosphate isomerase-like protein (cupin superfamily)
MGTEREHGIRAGRDKIVLSEKFARIDGFWQPKIVGELNGQYLKVAKFQGSMVWHQHAGEDELFLVVKGKIVIHLRDRAVELAEGEAFVVPRGVEHRPEAEAEAHVLMCEPVSTLHTGDVKSERTVSIADQEWL